MVMDEEGRRNVREALFKIIKTQMRDGKPPETKKTFERLRSLGFSRKDTLKYIACVILTEMQNMVKENRSYNEEGYVEALKALPKLPWDDEPANEMED